MQSSVFLDIRHISKTYPGVKALQDVSLQVKKGEVHALVGANGAGKSTLIKILGGVLEPDEGAEILVDGEITRLDSAMVSAKKGISVIYQDFSLFSNLTVYENIAISHISESKEKVLKWDGIIANAKQAIAKLNVNIDVFDKVEHLSTAKQQLVAIARAIAYNSKMIIMDEPTSALSKDEVKALFDVIRMLKDKGISILFVSHKLDELFEISDRYSIVRDGKYIATFDQTNIDKGKMISLMVGREVERNKTVRDATGKTMLEVKNLYKRGNFKDISFTLREGEILGITGIVGAGRSELAQAIFGISKIDSGEIILNNNSISIRSATDAVKYGIGYIPENRQTQGLVLSKSIMENIVIITIRSFINKFGLIDERMKLKVAKDWIKKLNITPHFENMEARQLSGGNQQRIVIAKWLCSAPKILIIDEPTNGVDIGAKEEIHAIIRELATQGIAIILISSELEEVMDLSNRIMVMRNGRISSILNNSYDVTHEMIMNHAILGSNNTEVS